jgi:hypothetical protein
MNIKQTLKKTVLGAAAVATLGGASLAATSADAHPHGNAGAAVGAGILGFALGATIASAHHNYAPYGYDYGPGYYGRSYDGSGYYGRSYDGSGYYGRAYDDTCRSSWHWSPYYGRYVRTVRCY